MMKIQCTHCKKTFESGGNIGTKNRNHCPYCLYSKHLDSQKPGDRKSNCLGEMKPIDIQFKKSKKDRYGKIKYGEIVILHECMKCHKKSFNRLAGDDSEKKVLEIFKSSTHSKDELTELNRQLFGENVGS